MAIRPSALNIILEREIADFLLHFSVSADLAQAGTLRRRRQDRFLEFYQELLAAEACDDEADF